MEDQVERSNIHDRNFSSGRKYAPHQLQSSLPRECQSREGYNSVRACSTNEMRSTMGIFVYNTPKKYEKSCDFFKDTRIDSCSYVKGTRSPERSYMAVPFYEKPLKTYADSMSRSAYKESFNNFQYKQKTIPYVGMGTTKPLERYNANAYRNRLNTTNEFYYPQNKIQNVQIGDRTAYYGDKNNAWKTTNMVEYPQIRYSSKFTNHSGIQAYRVRWDQHLKRKN